MKELKFCIIALAWVAFSITAPIYGCSLIYPTWRVECNGLGQFRWTDGRGFAHECASCKTKADAYAEMSYYRARITWERCK